jgi:iron(III) transport system ATP-binding protein
LELIGLPAAGDRKPSELSGGERQRVALARALAPGPVIILLDEPFSNLDAERRVRIREHVREILKRARATAIFVTHDQEEALFMGDRLGVMRKGRVEQLGLAEDLFKAPATKFVAEFLGHAEFLPAEVTALGLQTEIGLLDQATNLPEGTELEVGFRADDVTFAPDPEGSAQITERFFQGAVTLYRLRLASGKVVHSMQPHYLEHGPGLRVSLRFDPNHPLPLYQSGTILPLAASAPALDPETLE